LQTEVKEEQRNLTISGKNYRRRSYCYYGNGKRWRRRKYTSDFDAWTLKSEVNLALMRLKLRKYYRVKGQLSR